MAMKSFLAPIPAIVLALLLVGCGNKEAQVVGKWKVKTLPNLSNVPNAALAQSMLSGVTYEFKADKHFTTSVPAAGAMGEAEGTWSLSGDTITMTTTKAAGQDAATLKKMIDANPQAKAMLAKEGNGDPFNKTATLGGDGKTLTMKSSQGASMTLEKDSGS